jgi:hypothetical protein
VSKFLGPLFLLCFDSSHFPELPWFTKYVLTEVVALGVGDVLHDPSNYFQQIVNRYSATIAALFFGETIFAFLSLDAMRFSCWY